MNYVHLRVLLFILLTTGGVSVLKSQNLVPNYSFETISTCPLLFGEYGPMLAPPWVGPTFGTPDIFNACAMTGVMDVPTNIFGDQPAKTGEGYAGIFCKLTTYEYREYIQVALTEPLTAGVWYTISFFVSPAEDYCTVKTIGAYLSVTAPGSMEEGPLNVTPQVESNGDFLNDYDNWILISGCLLAEGGELYITIGNFNSDANTPVNTDCQVENHAYYYIDDVVVQENTEPATIPLDLEGPEFACFSYEIDPEIDDYILTWEDGTHGPTLVLTESGTYNLTITDGCNYGVDSIEVMIGGNFPPIDLGPVELSICNGDVYSISLDPDLSVYTWNDGSSDPTYDITTSGTYSVTLDDGCAVSIDEITIEVLDPPTPFILGDEDIICEGSEIEFSFLPTLGDFIWQDGSTESTYIATESGT